MLIILGVISEVVSTLIMEAAGSSGICIPFCQTAWGRIPEDRNLHSTCLLTVAFSIHDTLPDDDKFIAYPIRVTLPGIRASRCRWRISSFTFSIVQVMQGLITCDRLLETVRNHHLLSC